MASASPFPPSAFPASPAQVPPSGLTLEAIVREAHEQGHSDVHLGVGEQPRFRSRGEIETGRWPATDAATFQAWLKEILSPTELDTFRRDKDYDGSFAFPFVRVRINVMESLRGPAMVLRLIPHAVASLDALGLPVVLKELCGQAKGLVLVTGPTGSGKSTTLAAMVDHINRTMARHILTIEDPVEFVHQSHQSLVRHRQVGQHTKHFETALRAALREDPDVILIGEIRDQHTLTTALEASQTGHLVLGTLHTNSAVKTVERVLGMVPVEAQASLRMALSESLLAVVTQGLLRTTNGQRTAFHDILINNEACKDYIQRGDLEAIETIMERSRFEGMQTANQALAALVESGVVLADDALAQSQKRNELAQALRGRQ